MDERLEEIDAICKGIGIIRVFGRREDKRYIITLLDNGAFADEIVIDSDDSDKIQSYNDMVERVLRGRLWRGIAY